MNRSSPRPLIGISACLKENGRGGWQHTVGEKYVQAAIRAVGGLPVLIPAVGPEFGDEPGFIEAMDRLLDSLDGVLLTGSPSNVEPHHYGKESRDGTLHDRARDATTMPLIRHTIAIVPQPSEPDAHPRLSRNLPPAPPSLRRRQGLDARRPAGPDRR